MTLDSLIMLAGGLVAVLPFLGFPNSWDTVILVVLGVIIVSFGIVVRRRAPRNAVRDRDAQFIENAPKQDQ